MALAGCGDGAVAVDPPAPPGAARAACSRLSEALPDEIHGLAKRSTDPSSPFIRAWGDPAVVLRCGVARPRTLRPESQVIGVNRVEWLAEEQESGYRFTSTGRGAFVEVTVPDDYAPEVDPLVDLAPAMKRALPVRDDVGTTPPDDEEHDHDEHEH